MCSTYYPQVVQVVAGDDFTVYAYFSDGAIRQADIKPLIAEGGVFEQIADEGVFRALLTVINGTVAWDTGGNRDEYHCIDIDPLVIYETALPVSDPLAEVA